MAKIVAGRMAARIEGDFVVFIIGMRINKPWKLTSWWPVFIGMPRMLKELQSRPAEETGFLGHNGLSMKGIVQYWRSFDHLEAYARSKDRLHWPAWVEFNRTMKNAREDVGIWHETYCIRAGEYEAIYSGMPPYGLGRVSSLIPATGSQDGARKRLKAAAE